jgi:nucleoside-diphosphate-sugar epimerase
MVTGGTGFVGAYVVDQLLDAGHSVTLYELAPETRFLEAVCGAERVGRAVEVVVGDVTDPFGVLGTMRGSGAERVIHLAATLSGMAEENPLRAFRVNCEGTVNVFEAALLCGVERVVWASTLGVFVTPGFNHADRSLSNQVITDDAAQRPEGILGACKSFNERLAANYSRHRGLSAVGLRYAFVYGYGKEMTVGRGTRVGFMTDLIDRPALGEPSTVIGGDTIFDWVYVGDAARSTVLASMTTGSTSPALNICGQRHTVREVAGLVRELVPNCQLEVEDGTWGDSLLYDGSFAAREIGYEPAVGIKDGLARNIEMLRRHSPDRSGLSAKVARA